MKKLLYLVPLALAALSLTPFALYKDTVNYGTSLDTLTPSHWKVLDVQVSFYANLTPLDIGASNLSTYEPEPVSNNASFKGFPFGAYFSHSETSTTTYFKASAYSWLWVIVDLLLIIVSLEIASRVNRKRKP